MPKASSPASINTAFWSGKRVLITGHTGFKGSWLTLILLRLGAHVSGFALPPSGERSLFTDLGLGSDVASIEGDIRDFGSVRDALERSHPEIVIHMAAQAFVRRSYEDPVGTFETNVIGTAHVLEAARQDGGVRALVNVTSDKCYAGGDDTRPHKEGDPLGGRDPYSASKAGAESVTAAYRASFVALERLASVRAGNVIGGGDWGPDRLVPDLVRAASTGRTAILRSPAAVRPWQHVLDCLHGYLLLARRLWDDTDAASAWNFGPPAREVTTVAALADRFTELWPGSNWRPDHGEHPPEAETLLLDSTRARSLLGWRTHLNVDEAILWAVEAYRAMHEGTSAKEICESQIARFEDVSRGHEISA